MLFLLLQNERLKRLNHELEEKAESAELQINTISRQYRQMLEEREVTSAACLYTTPYIYLGNISLSLEIELFLSYHIFFKYIFKCILGHK